MAAASASLQVAFTASATARPRATAAKAAALALGTSSSQGTGAVSSAGGISDNVTLKSHDRPLRAGPPAHPKAVGARQVDCAAARAVAGEERVEGWDGGPAEVETLVDLVALELGGHRRRVRRRPTRPQVRSRQHQPAPRDNKKKHREAYIKRRAGIVPCTECRKPSPEPT